MCPCVSPRSATSSTQYMSAMTAQNRCPLGANSFPLPVTSTASLMSTLLNSSTTSQQQHHLLQQQTQHANPTIYKGINTPILPQVNALKEPAVKLTGSCDTCYPLLPCLENLIPITFLHLDQHATSNTMFSSQAPFPASSTPLNFIPRIHEDSGFQTPPKWVTLHKHYSPPGCLSSLFAVTDYNQGHSSSISVRKKPSDFSINRLLQSHPDESVFDKRSDGILTSRHLHDEKGNSGRKQRTIYGASQTRILEKAFEEQQYMVGAEREMLAERLGLSEAQVRVWFQNRRSKWRKQLRANVYVQ